MYIICGTPVDKPRQQNPTKNPIQNPIIQYSFRKEKKIMNMKQSYSIDFEDPPLSLRSTFHLTLWWVNPVVRKVLMTSPWPSKIRQGEYPHFCLFKGFCQYFETDGELEDHYQLHPNHRLTKQDHDGFRAGSFKTELEK